MLIRDNFQNYKRYDIPKCQLLLADIPYNVGNNAYGSNPSWYIGGDNKNGASDKAGKTFFDTDENFKPAEFMHFASQMLKKEPKEKNAAPCMIVFCAFDQQMYLIDLAKKYGLNNYINLIFRKNFSAQVLKANMRVVGNAEYGLILYRDKLPKFRNEGKMVMNVMDWEKDNTSPKLHPTQKPIPLLEKLIKTFTDEGDVVIDPCAGSGSTLIAAENLKRKAYGFEITREMHVKASAWIEQNRVKQKEIANLDMQKQSWKRLTQCYFNIMSNLKLYNYQQRIVEFCKKEPKAILAVGMGLGKTASILHYINEVKPKSCIIIAPKFVANHVWKQECIKWNLHDLHDKLVICWHYNKKKRLDIIREAYDNNKYLIVTRDNVGDISDMKLEFDLLVMDELTSYKNHESGRSGSVYKINAKQRIGLTGTFITNSAIDIYGQLVAVGFGNNAPQKDINRGFYRWRATHFRDVLSGAGLKFQKWQNVTPLKDIIAPYKKNIFTLDSSDWLEVPEVSYIPHVVELSDHEMNEYLRLNTMLSVNLNDEVIAFTENQKFAKLQTLCNGFVYVDDVKTGLREVKRGEHSTKLDEVVEFVARAVSEGEQVLLFYAFIEEREWILEKLKKEHIKFADIKSKNAINKWNNKDIEVLLGHPSSCSHGLNLHLSGARMMVWSSLPYDAELWSQGCARLIRQGQKRGVQIHSFVAKNTVEVKKYSSLQVKQELLHEFIDLTK